MAAEEYLLGEFPSEDGSDYDPFSISPPFTSILKTMDRFKLNYVRIAIVGRLYTGDRFISGVSIKTDRESVRQAAAMDIFYEKKWQFLMQLDTVPMHVTGVSIRPL